MIIANFINKQDALVTGLDQYDYGQVLRIQGLKLPTAVEVHFGLEETGGTTTTRIGVMAGFLVAFVAMYGWEKVSELWKRFYRGNTNK